LFVSRHTVKTQVASVYRKLGVSSRAEAVDRIEDLGLAR
jgi:DNA-binding NarL/FixJ family response regulator